MNWNVAKDHKCVKSCPFLIELTTNTFSNEMKIVFQTSNAHQNNKIDIVIQEGIPQIN